MFATRMAAVLSAALLAGCSVFGGKAAEEPPYTLVMQDGDFEIRDYSAMVVAETVVPGDREDAVSTGFSRLFDYISGENEGWRGGAHEGKKIEMTAPVIVENEATAKGADIDMTAPVLVEGEGNAWQVAFVLPPDATMDTAPIPSSLDVTLAEIPAREVAVVRFSGFLDAGNVAENRQRLAAWLDKQGRAHKDDWQSAGYNPPWTIPMLRRNEVMVTLE